MSARGIVPPNGGPGWSMRSLVDVLTNPVYCGRIAIAGERTRSCRKGAHHRASPAIKENGVPAIISIATYENVQARMKARKLTKHRISHGAGALSGILACGNCGHKLVKKTKEGKTFYCCNSPYIRPHLGCKQWRAYEWQIMPEICASIVKEIDFEMLSKIQAKPEQAPKELDHLKQQIESLKKKITKGSENLLLAAPEVFGPMQEQLLKWKSDLAKAENTLSASEQTAEQRGSYVEFWESVKDKLIEIPTGYVAPVAHASISKKRIALAVTVKDAVRIMPVYAMPDAVRGLLKSLNLTVTLSWKPKGTRYYSLDRGVLRADFGSSVFENLAAGDLNIPTKFGW